MTRQGAERWGHAAGVLGFAPAGFPPSGTASVGVARQWGGRLGKVDHGQGAVSLGAVSSAGHPLGDMRWSLPPEWTTDQARLHTAGVPTAPRGERSRPQGALAMVLARGTRLPPRGSAGDDARGRPSWVRRRRAGLGERSRLAVPGQTLLRALEPALPASSGRGRPSPPPWQRVEAWRAALAAGAGQRGDGRDGAKGPLGVEAVQRRVVARTPRRHHGHEER